MKLKTLLYSITLANCLTIQAQNGLKFDGVNDNVSTSYSGISGNGARTIEAKVKTTTNCDPLTGGTQNVLVDWGSMALGERSTFNIWNGNAIRWEIAGSGINGSIPVNDGVWHHVAVTYDPTATPSVKLYVDGVLDGSGNHTIPVTTGTTSPIVLGKRQDNFNYFNGALDEVRVWDVARTQSEIQANMNSELCTLPTSLKLYYTFNQGNAGGLNSGLNTVQDFSATAANGSLNGFSLIGINSNWVSGSTLASGFQQTSQTAIGCGTFYWQGNSYTSSGTYKTLVSGSGLACDTIKTILLTMQNVLIYPESQVACANFLWPQTGLQYTASGTYDDTLISQSGCDSIIRLNLIVNLPDSTTETIVACNSYTWSANSTTYSSSGLYTMNFTNMNGCDSVAILNLTINPIFQTSFSQNACDSFFWQAAGQMYYQPGAYTENLASVDGCDSVVTLNLTFGAAIDSTVVVTGVTLFANQSGANYQWIDCSTNLPIANATQQSFVPDINGVYACLIDFNGCQQLTECKAVTTLDKKEVVREDWLVYPNPSKGIFFVKGLDGIVQITILDFSGRMIHNNTMDLSKNDSIDLTNFEDGLYFLRIISEQNEKKYVLKKF